MVAAALEVANKDVIEKVGQLSLEKSQTPLGWRFLEKIVQLPVVVPPPTDSGVESYMSLLTGNQNVQTGFAAGPPDSRKVNEYKAKLADSKSVADVRGITERLIGEAAPEDRSAVAEASNQKYIEKFSDRDPAVREFVHSVAALIGNNPRQIKRYINVFRFYSALRYNLLTQSMASGSPAKLPSDKELAKFIALTIQWPQALDCFRIMRDSSEGPGGKSKSLLGVLEDKSRSFAGGHATVDSEWSDFLKTQGLPSDGWIASCEFRKFLAEDPSLWGVERCGLW